MATALIAAITVAITPQHHPQHVASHALRHTYGTLYRRVSRRFGQRTPGRHIVHFGMRVRSHGRWRVRTATSHEVGRSIRTFRRWLAPPIPAARAGDGSALAPPYSSGGNWSIPAYIVNCESHGNYGAVNPSSGAYGAYQIMPSTAAAYGCDLSTPRGQDACAARIWARQGPGAWSCA